MSSSKRWDQPIAFALLKNKIENKVCPSLEYLLLSTTDSTTFETSSPRIGA